MKFYVTKEVFDYMPSATFGLVSINGVNNNLKYEEIKDLLHKNILKCEKHFEEKNVKEDPVIKLYRNAFNTLGINPNKFMSSIEALLTRISKKKGFPEINPIVDLGNAISLKFFLPIGAHDLDSMSNNEFCVRTAHEDDTFIPFGSTEKEAVEKDEVIYSTGNEVRTRRWIWRQSEKGKITQDTKNLLFIIDGFKENIDNIIACRDELNERLQSVFNCPTKIGLIDKDTREFITDINE